MRPTTSKPGARSTINLPKPNRARLASAKGARDQFNPFSIPPDEKIFTFKEEEKARKLEERKRNSKLRIWDKNKPEREGKLRAIRDTDPDLVGVKFKEDFFRKQQSMDIPIDIPTESIHIDNHKKESRHRLLERNREIFLIAQMLSIKHEEIQKLEDFQTLRDEGLRFFEDHLNSDIKQFIDFFKENREASRQAVLEAENQAKEKQKKLTELKRLKAEYQDYENKIK